MYDINVTVPAIGSWVYWVSVEQANGRVASGLCQWYGELTEALREEGISGFWIDADNVAQAHLKGQICDRRQQIMENHTLSNELEDIVARLRAQLTEIEEPTDGN